MQASSLFNQAKMPIPASAGIGLRTPHFDTVLENKPDLGWIEIHSENFFSEGGYVLHLLEKFSALYPLSVHGVGLSIGSADAIDQIHLKKLKTLVERFQPALVSEHLCWSSINSHYLNDLLPLPYTEESLQHIRDKVLIVQDTLKRPILLENISVYLEFNFSSLTEEQFITELVKQTGCGILLDVNNIYVNHINHGWNPYDYIHNIPHDAIYEIHLAGYEDRNGYLIDTHGNYVSEPVWALYKTVIETIGQRPTLIEWDNDIPELDILLAEKHKADMVLEQYNAVLI